MRGEKQMIYKNIIFEAAPFLYDLEFDDRITLVGGDSGTGKTVLYEMLEDIRLTDEYKSIKLFNYKSDNLIESIKQCRDSFIVVDNADILINDEVRRFINFEFSNQYMLFLRNCDGLNVSDKSFKVLKFDNNRITLEEELWYEIFMDRGYQCRTSLLERWEDENADTVRMRTRSD